MTTADFLTIEEVVMDAAFRVSDSEFKSGIPIGYYKSTVQQAMEELAIDSFFNKITLDLPFERTKLEMPFPEKFFNIAEIYLFNGGCCTPENSVWVWYKRLYNNKGGGSNYTSKRKESMNSDAFLKPYNSSDSLNSYQNVYWANQTSNGTIGFSPNSSSFEYVRFVGRGFNVVVGEVPIVPRTFRAAVVDYTRVRVLEIIKQRDKTRRLDYLDAQNDLNGVRLNRKGSWEKAINLVKCMPTWERESYNEYFSRMNY